MGHDFYGAGSVYDPAWPLPVLRRYGADKKCSLGPDAMLCHRRGNFIAVAGSRL